MDQQLYPIVSLRTDKPLGPIIVECKPKASNTIAMGVFAVAMIVGGVVLVCAMGLRIVNNVDKIPWVAAEGESLASFALFGAIGLALIAFAGIILRGLIRKIGYRLYLCEEGLCAVTGSKTEALLWQEITSIDQDITDVPVRLVKYAPDSMMPRVTGGVLNLRGNDGTELSIGTDEFPSDLQARLFRAIETEALGKSITWNVRKKSPA
jgi:hypothetical protein